MPDIFFIVLWPKIFLENGLKNYGVKVSNFRSFHMISGVQELRHNFRSTCTLLKFRSSWQLWRLMSRRTRTRIPTTSMMLEPKIEKHLPLKLKKMRLQKKKHYDMNAKPLKPLQKEQIVRLETKRGYGERAIVIKEALRPRSYIVKTESGREFERNRRHLLPVQEEYHQKSNGNVPHQDLSRNQNLNQCYKKFIRNQYWQSTVYKEQKAKMNQQKCNKSLRSSQELVEWWSQIRDSRTIYTCNSYVNS